MSEAFKRVLPSATILEARVCLTLARELSDGAARPKVEHYSMLKDVDARFEAPPGSEWPAGYERLQRVFLLDAKSAPSESPQVSFEIGSDYGRGLDPGWGLSGVEDVVGFAVIPYGKARQEDLATSYVASAPGNVLLLDLKSWRKLWERLWVEAFPELKGVYEVGTVTLERLKVAETNNWGMDSLRWTTIDARWLLTKDWASLEAFAEYVAARMKGQEPGLPPDIEPLVELPRERPVAYFDSMLRRTKDLSPAAWALRLALPSLAELSDLVYEGQYASRTLELTTRGLLPVRRPDYLNKGLPPTLRFTPDTLAELVAKGHAGEPLAAPYEWRTYQQGKGRWVLRPGTIPVSRECAQQLREGTAPTLEGWLEPHAHAAYQHFAGLNPGS